ncbi:MAG: hypothetical protein OEM43_05065 [Gammaproteobacteria bacterium]|nr:hypothetical protein [Gammaproteobacteria bacterium]
MKTKHLLEKLKKFLDADRRAQLAQVDSIEEVLDKLEEKEQKLLTKLEAESDPDERERLEMKLAVCQAQCKKGVQLIEELLVKKEAHGEAPDPG